MAYVVLVDRGMGKPAGLLAATAQLLALETALVTLAPHRAHASFEVETVLSDRVAALRYANTTGHRIRTAYLRIANRLPPIGGISLRSSLPDTSAVDRFVAASDAFDAAQFTDETIGRAPPSELAILVEYIRLLNAAEKLVMERQPSRPNGDASSSPFVPQPKSPSSGAERDANVKRLSDACLRDYTPYVGQEGRDIFWLPTDDERIQRMLQLAGTTAADHVVDLGSGDGKIPIAAARDFGATARGIEFDAGLVKLSRCLSTASGVGDKTTMVEGDIFTANFSDATVITMYLGDQVNVCLRHRLLALRPGTRIVSHQFVMGDWKADEGIDPQPGRAGVYLWNVPARVDGTWEVRTANGDAFGVALSQTFQEIHGRVMFDSSSHALLSSRLDGDQLVFVMGDLSGAQKTFIGTVRGDQLEGTLRGPTDEIAASGVRRETPRVGEWADRAAGCESFYRRDERR